MATNESKKSGTGSPSQTQSKHPDNSNTTPSTKDNEYRVKEVSASSNVKACIHNYKEK